MLWPARRWVNERTQRGRRPAGHEGCRGCSLLHSQLRSSFSTKRATRWSLPDTDPQEETVLVLPSDSFPFLQPEMPLPCVRIPRGCCLPAAGTAEYRQHHAARRWGRLLPQPPSCSVGSSKGHQQGFAALAPITWEQDVLTPRGEPVPPKTAPVSGSQSHPWGIASSQMEQERDEAKCHQATRLPGWRVQERASWPHKGVQISAGMLLCKSLLGRLQRTEGNSHRDPSASQVHKPRSHTALSHLATVK